MADESPLKALEAKLDALLGRVAAQREDPEKGPVKYERFFEVNQQKKAAVEGLRAIKDELEQAKARHAAELKDLKEASARQVGELAAKHQADLGLRDLGLDDEGRSEVVAKWARLDEQARPKSPVEWWKGITEAHAKHLADPEQVEAPAVPRALSPFLPQPAAAEPAASEPAAGPRAGRASVIVGNPDRGAARRRESQPVSRVLDGAVAKGDQETFWATLQARRAQQQ